MLREHHYDKMKSVISSGASKSEIREAANESDWNLIRILRDSLIITCPKWMEKKFLDAA